LQRGQDAGLVWDKAGCGVRLGLADEAGRDVHRCLRWRRRGGGASVGHGRRHRLIRKATRVSAVVCVGWGGGWLTEEEQEGRLTGSPGSWTASVRRAASCA
jgi:hypothetical protein